MSNWNINSSRSKLQSVIDSEIGYRSYQLARFYNDATVDLSYFYEYNDSGWNYSRSYNIQDADLAMSPKTNVIKSVIDSLVSKVANQKVRPYFSPVNGLYETRAVAKQAQQYMDIMFEESKIHDKLVLAFRNACIFGIGYVFYNPFLKRIEVPGTWQVATSNCERGYGKPTKCLVEYKCMPVTLLDDYGIKGKYRSEYVNFRIYIDTIDKTARAYVNNVEALKQKYDCDIVPLVWLYHTPPVFGNRTTSLVDELDGIQTNIDLLNSKISAAAQLTPANITYVAAGNGITASDVSNRTGTVYTVKTGPGASQLPVVNVSPVPFDPVWTTLLDQYIKQAYEMAGISQLSAMSRKPAGLDSGKALDTLEDVESDRFQIQVDNFIHAFVDVANLVIELSDGNILPNSVDTSTYTWDDIRKQRKLFKVQYSAASALSKDPSTKIQQILQLNQAGLITIDKVSKYLDSPDLEEAYRGASAVIDAIDSIICRTIENEETPEIPDYIGYQQLLTQIIVEENKMLASGENESIQRLEKLKSSLLDIMNSDGFVDLTQNNVEDTMQSESGITNAGVNDVTGITSQANAMVSPTNEDNLTNEQQVNETSIEPVIESPNE